MTQGLTEMPKMKPSTYGAARCRNLEGSPAAVHDGDDVVEELDEQEEVAAKAKLQQQPNRRKAPEGRER